MVRETESAEIFVQSIDSLSGKRERERERDRDRERDR